MTDRLKALSDAGVSIWLDDLDRNRIQSGGLARLVDEKCVRGVTTNPSIFDKAISTGAEAYAEQLSSLAASGADVDEIIIGNTRFSSLALPSTPSGKYACWMSFVISCSFASGEVFAA